jgi:hypothetical protein
MEIDDNSPDLPGMPEKNLPKKKKVADLKKELLEGVPVASRVPPGPNNPTELSAVGEEYEKAFGFKRAVVPPSIIIIGDRILETGKLHEVRTGTTFGGFPGIGGLYEYAGDIGLKFVEIELPEGVDPMMAAKAVKWGIAPTIAPAVVRDYPPTGFLTMRPFKPTDLLDRPVLAAHKAAVEKELRDAYGGRIASDGLKIGTLEDEVQNAKAAKIAAENWAAEYKSDDLLIKWLKWLIGILILIGVIVYLIRH